MTLILARLPHTQLSTPEQPHLHQQGSSPSPGGELQGCKAEEEERAWGPGGVCLHASLPHLKVSQQQGQTWRLTEGPDDPYSCLLTSQDAPHSGLGAGDPELTIPYADPKILRIRVRGPSK